MAKTLSWSRRAPGTAAPGPFRCFCPVSSSAVPAAALGRLPRVGRALWGLSRGVSGHLGGSPSAWEVLGQQDEPEMSQPCQYHKRQGCGDPQDPRGGWALVTRVCQPVLQVLRASLLMHSSPTIHLCPQSPVLISPKQLFAVQTSPLGPQESQPLHTPLSPGVEGSFPPSLQVLRVRDVGPCPSQLWES